MKKRIFLRRGDGTDIYTLPRIKTSSIRGLSKHKWLRDPNHIFLGFSGALLKISYFDDSVTDYFRNHKESNLIV